MVKLLTCLWASIVYAGTDIYHTQTRRRTSHVHLTPNSVVGADIFLYSIVGAINSHTVRPPHMPLGIDSVVGTGIYHTE